MGRDVTFIGFGEAGAAFALDWPAGQPRPRAFDLKTAAASARNAKLADYARCDVDGVETAAAALDGARAALCLVTADQALAAATEHARLLDKGALWFDMNSVAPETKRAAALAVNDAGARYVDVAIMAPVHPRRRAVPLLVAGPHAEAGMQLLKEIGFTDVRSVGQEIGAASAVKMIRSVLVKGMEALTAECVLAAEAAGVRREVLASLDASTPDAGWEAQADYNLDRMITHGIRRAAEMEEAVKTLDALGTGSEMTRATVLRQRAIGERGLHSAAGLAAKIGAILGAKRSRAA
jgi:3-hydroxyisobutyrate dehydrogenase-like beta-hydroxyacid dehydrogenase